MRHLTTRLAAVLVTAALYTATRGTGLWPTVVMGFGFVHYFLGFVYSRGALKAACSRVTSAALVAGLAVAGLVLFETHASLFVVFAMHHALNEAYLIGDGVRSDDELRGVRATAFFLNAVTYFFVLRREFELTFEGAPAVYLCICAGAVLAYAFFALTLARLRATGSIRDILLSAAPEAAAPAILAVSLFARPTLYQFIVYHLAFWLIFPAVTMARRGAPGALRFALVNVGLTVAAVVAVRGVLASTDVTLDAVIRQFYLWSFLHIALSLALSRANPGWIRRLFSPAQTAAAA